MSPCEPLRQSGRIAGRCGPRHLRKRAAGGRALCRLLHAGGRHACRRVGLLAWQRLRGNPGTRCDGLAGGCFRMQ
eukprot:4349613-Alexandrium_andersonii.AAC.1